MVFLVSVVIEAVVEGDANGADGGVEGWFGACVFGSEETIHGGNWRGELLLRKCCVLEERRLSITSFKIFRMPALHSHTGDDAESSGQAALYGGRSGKAESATRQPHSPHCSSAVYLDQEKTDRSFTLSCHL